DELVLRLDACLHHQQRDRRPRRPDALLHALPLSAGVRQPEDGVRLGDGLGAPPSRCPLHGPGLRHPALLGLLPGPAGMIGRLRLNRSAAHALLIGRAVLMADPLLWMAVSSFTPPFVLGYSTLTVHRPTLANYDHFCSA